ncbi:MAG: transglutaminase family protein [Candidatus Hinthialibacter antarcticus]|nr:transglutaminase family protein [Candidatus Hinthialibacter antarcticus]
MAIQVALRHQTHYNYDRLVSLSPQVVRLRPAPHSRTPILSYNLTIRPEEHFINWQQDPHGNYLARLVFEEKTRLFHVDVNLVAEISAINPFDFFLEDYAEESPFQYKEEERVDLEPFLETKSFGPEFEKYLKTFDLTKRMTNDFLVDINQQLERDIDYIIRMEPGVQTPEETLRTRKGSCRDSAWLLAHVLRRIGLATRFASGYLIQLKSDVESLDGPSGPVADFTDLHAWCEVYLPGAGWIGLDPTSGLFTGEGHIPLACTPKPQGAAPVSGAVSKSEVEFEHHMSVTRIHEDPRVTKPYRDDQWQRIYQTGLQVDQEIHQNDMRLTMGGEPTFVSIDDMEGEEWNGGALGENKYRLASQLFHQMRKRFSKGALLHYGQGKWYPGESIPRWALTCYWRKDGAPIWKDESLIASGNEPLGHTVEDAQRFIAHVADRLGVQAKYAIPAWEDPYHIIFHERKTPVNIDPRQSLMDEPEERRRLAKLLEKGVGNKVGYVLPLSRGKNGTSPTWTSGEWVVRTETLFLFPGDSPMGYRLPLDSLKWETKADRLYSEAYDMSAPRRELPSYKALLSNTSSRANVRMERSDPKFLNRFKTKSGGRSSEFGEAWKSALASYEKTHSYSNEEWSGVVRTALCVEPREGRLNVFLPPLRFIEQYLELVALVEETAKELNLPVRIEGYQPPGDSRMQQFKVTPDPGVIEVNVHPASNWNELVEITHSVYDEARLARLGTEKFMQDGKHTGTNGGNHFVMGGASTNDSPFLRRPDLLKSLIKYWINHPSLSYLFSGMFIGPTSQAPRVDEARYEAVYEIEIACAQVPENGPCPPWIVDRIFRHLLIDVSGNTHRAEFCIDKLYSPDSPSGRLGLVEFRNFEMPPHYQMSLAQQLLLRALCAWMWKTPYTEKLARWGTQLHDRFMLPHFVWHDFNDVIDQLKTYGFEFDASWYDAHFEFRFPKIGSVAYDGVEIELRQAIEPWHVLGEEQAVGGTTRYVDSSLERIQIKVSGAIEPRHIITCNGIPVPLHPTGRQSEFCAGIRFRAWQPPSCLHPTIPVHAPLVIELIDTWNQRSLGGCKYTVSHPGGRSYDTFPVNALEAESRRAGLFSAIGHTPGPVTAPPKQVGKEYPFTLDLRTIQKA